jgi:hypothetical protein
MHIFIISLTVLSTLGCFLFLHFWRASLSAQGLIGSIPVEGKGEKTWAYPHCPLQLVIFFWGLSYKMFWWCYFAYYLYISRIFLGCIKVFQYFISIWHLCTSCWILDIQSLFIKFKIYTTLQSLFFNSFDF